MKWLRRVSLGVVTISLTAGCSPRSGCFGTVEVTGGGPREHRIQQAVALASPARVAELKQAMQTECPAAGDANLDTLRVNAIWLPPDRHSVKGDVFVQLALEHVDGDDAEAIVGCGKTILERRILELARGWDGSATRLDGP